MAVTVLAMAPVIAQSPNAQFPTTETPLSAPPGYALHQSVDLGGRIANPSGSSAMYSTLVNLRSGPRVLGETFEMRALPGHKGGPVDSVSAFGSGFGGDPNNFARLTASKGKAYDFSGFFRRDRQYFDYDLLGNPNIPGGQSIPIGSAAAPAGALSWPQLENSAYLFNTVRRMTDVNLTLLPLSKLTYRVGYSQNIFQGPSLSPSGFQMAGGEYDLLLEEMQRNSSDDFTGALEWKPVQNTRLSFEEQVDHIKADSYFTMDPAYFYVQEPDGTKVAPLSNYDSLAPYTSGSCNANSMGTAPLLSAPQTPGGLPVINPACAVMTSYRRTQPTRILYPTEILRLQSSSVRNLAMNGDLRYTDANMSMPGYYEDFQGLSNTTREVTYTATANAKREALAADYGVDWRATEKAGFSDQVTYWNVQQPGTAAVTGVTTLSTPATAGNETLVYAGTLTTTKAAPHAPTFDGSGTVSVPWPDFFGQKFVSNDATATWDGWSRARVSLTYRYRKQTIAEGIPHHSPIPSCGVPVFNDAGYCGTATLNQNGGALNVTLRPTNEWNVHGSVEVLYADNVFTAVAPRQQQHYRLKVQYRAKSWATIFGAYNDMELRNNTDNQESSPAAAEAGLLDHMAHTRAVSTGADLAPNEHYGLRFEYAYTDVYTATNICYDAGAGATLPGAATPSGAACPGATVLFTNYYEFGPVKDFMDAPTQSGSAALTLSPSHRLLSNIGYSIHSVAGSRFYNDARDVAGSLVSTYQSPFVRLAWTLRPGLAWNAEYNFFGYGEGGPSGAQYCSTSNPTPGSPVPVVPCSSLPYPTGLTESPAGLTAPRNFHANNVTTGLHYEF